MSRKEESFVIEYKEECKEVNGVRWMNSLFAFVFSFVPLTLLAGQTPPFITGIITCISVELAGAAALLAIASLETGVRTVTKTVRKVKT